MPIIRGAAMTTSVVPHKRDVGLNNAHLSCPFDESVVPHKRDVGLNVIENEIIPSDLESFLTRGTWV